MRWSEKLYHLMLRAYPRDFRTRYGAPMAQLFRDRLRGSGTPASAAVLWAQTLADWAVSLPMRHWERMTKNNTVRLGNAARRCVFLARYEANSSERNEITIQHLLLGILRQEPSLSEQVGDMRRAIEEMRAAERDRTDAQRVRWNNIHLDAETKRALIAAREIARAAGRKQVSPRDLAAAILRQKDSLAARLLREHMPD